MHLTIVAGCYSIQGPFCCRVPSNQCSLLFLRNGACAYGARPAGDGPSAGFGSSSGPSSGPGAEQHLPSTRYPHHGNILQSNNSTGETLLHNSHGSCHLQTPISMTFGTQCSCSCNVSLQLDRDKIRDLETGYEIVAFKYINGCVSWYTWMWHVLQLLE